MRKRIADERGVPPYIIFNDATLRAMAQSRPRTREEFLAVPGIGEKKYNDFAARFAPALADLPDDGAAAERDEIDEPRFEPSFDDTNDRE